MLSLDEAQKIILSEIQELTKTEVVPLLDSVGRILAYDLRTPFPQPPFTNSAMDGYALRARDTQQACQITPIKLKVHFFQSAGSPFSALPIFAACEIATGAPLPKGADTVVMKEVAQERQGKIILTKPLRKGENVRNKGEDLKKGTVILRAYNKIKERDIGLIASFGISSISVIKKPKVCYFSTGDEIVSLRKSRKEHQVYNSNAASLAALFQKERCQFFDLGHCPDRLSQTVTFIKKIRRLKPTILVITGGVSVGRRDFVREALEKSGAAILFHKVCIKPGKPILFAKLQETYIFALPGNPLSSQVGFYQFIYPALKKLQHQKNYFLREESAELLEDVFRRDRHLFLIGIRKKIDRKIFVIPIREGSGNVAAFARGDCFISVPQGSGKINKGTDIKIQSYL